MAAFSISSSLLPVVAWDWNIGVRYFRFDVVRHASASWFLDAPTAVGEVPGVSSSWRLLGWVDEGALPDVGDPGSFGDAAHSLTLHTDAKGRVSSVSAIDIQIGISQVTGLADALGGLSPGFSVRQEVFTADGTLDHWSLAAAPTSGILLSCQVSGLGRVPGLDYTVSGASLTLAWVPGSGEKIVVTYLAG